MAMFLCVFVCVIAGTLSFNVDIESRVVHRGNHNSMFGFAVQAHVEGDQSMVLIGAPEADTGRLFNVTRPGAVFRCDPNLPNRCQEMIFDTKGHNVPKPVESKSNQWFGATLQSSGANGPIVACAPRYVSYVTWRQNQRDPVGSCFLAKSASSKEVNEFSPCRTSNNGQRKTGVCQAGFSAAISKDGQRLFMGAPGSWFWQGRTFSLEPKEIFDFYTTSTQLDEGQLYSQSMDSDPVLISTSEGKPQSLYDDSYMGYSIAVGDFAGEATQGVAVGVPRGSQLRGLVVLYTWELQNIKNISGSQIGAYFGYSLAAGDIDGDGFDDVIVGAPMFTRPKSEGFEHGRVYIIYQGKDRSFTKNHARTGEISQARFGLSVASLGDINLDGFGDFAVGAPYGGPEGRGVVYIYHGSENGASSNPSQAIFAEDVTPPPFVYTFGFSLSGAVDLDHNSYTDLVVGAYKSDSAFVFRSRPVVKVMAEIRYVSDSKLISLTDKKCHLKNGTSIICSKVMFCLTYDGINVMRQMEFHINVDLDSKQKSSKRLFLMDTRDSSYSERIMLAQGKQTCREMNVYLDDEIRDKLTPIEVAMTYELITQRGEVIPPVLDQTTSNVVTDSMNIQKNCGPDNVCVPDLRMGVTTPTINYVLGSSDNVNIDVKVENSGEDAFEAAYYLQIPPGVTYSKMERLDKDEPDTSPIYCSIIEKDLHGNSTLKCDLGNPMTGGQLVRFRLVLEVDSYVNSLSFDMVTNSTNPEIDTHYDNTRHLPIAVVIRAHLEVIGASDPPELHYNASLYEATDLKDDLKLGPQVIHKYNIKNEGPYEVEEAEIYIMWPYQTLNGDNLMYMLVQPEWVGDMKCDVARHVNSLNLFVLNPYNSPLVSEKEAMLNSDLYKDVAISRGGGYYGQTYLEQDHQMGSSINYDQTQRQDATNIRQNENENRMSTFNRNEDRISSNAQERRQYGTANTQSNIGSNNAQTQNRFASTNVENRGQFDTSDERRQYDNRNRKQYTEERRYFDSEGRTVSKEMYDRDRTQYHEERRYFDSEGRSISKETYDRFSAQEEENIRRNIANAINAGNNQGVLGTGHIVREWNKTVSYDSEGNVVNRAESSTEYGSLGREGKAGSSFRTRYGANARGSTSQSNYNNQNSNQGQYANSYGSNGSNQQHKWTPEESINQDISRASSRTFHGDNKITVVGDESDEIGGLGAYAAQSPNNQFKYGIADMGVSGGSGEAQGSSGGYGASGSSYGASGSSYNSGSSGSSYRGAGSGGQYTGSGVQYGGSSVSGGQYGGSNSYNARGGASGYTQSGGNVRSSGGYSYSGGSSYSSQSQSQSFSGEKRQEETRRKREDQVDPQLREILARCEDKYKCEVIRCTTGRMVKGQEVWLALRSRINASVLNEISQERAIRLSTLAAARVSRLAQMGQPSEPEWKIVEAETLVTPQLEAMASSIPLWVVILSAIAGTLLLLLLIYALYKCGFFKRNRPSDHAERQPLNGHDEHL